MQRQPVVSLKKRQKQWLKKFPSVQVITNQYETTINNNLKYFRIFQIHAQPMGQKDSYKIFVQAMKNMPQVVKKEMNLSTLCMRRGNAIWFMSKQQLSPQQQQLLRQKPPKYRLRISQTDYQIVIKFVKQSSLQKKQNHQLILQLLNIKFKHLILKDCKYKELSKNVFFPKWSMYERDKRLEVSANIGLKFTLSYLQIQLFCDINNQIKVLNQKSILETWRNHNSNPKNYIGKKVMKMYGDRRTYVIEGILFQLNPMSTFQSKGKQITYRDYYKVAYQQIIHDLEQPLILVSTSYDYKIKQKGIAIQEFQSQIQLIPQLVCLTGIPQNVSQAFMDKIRLTPNDCLQQAEKFIKDINQHQKQFLVSSQNRRGVAHLLSQPIIKINKFTQVQPRDGQFRITQQIFQPIQMKDVLIVYSLGKNKQFDRKQVDSAIKILNKSGLRYKIQIKQKFQLEVKQTQSPEGWIKLIEDDIKQNGPPNFIIVALKSREAQFKDYLKQKLTYKLKIASQFFLRQKISYNQKKSMNIGGNVMKQIAAKQNKALWKLKAIKGFQDKLILLFGLSIQRLGNKFQLAISCNTDDQISRFKADVFCIETREIPKDVLEKIFYASIQLFIKNHSCKVIPNTIIVYRTGINNQKYAEEVLKTQYQILQDRVKYIAENKLKKSKFQPDIVYIQVTDRPALKFWIQEGGNQPDSFLPKVVNPQVGTVMRGYQQNQFSLVPYKARKGSAQPSYYKIFRNEGKVPLQFITAFTYAQTYMYYNWTGSVRLPEVLQYCKKLHQFVKSSDKQKNSAFSFEAPTFI